MPFDLMTFLQNTGVATTLLFGLLYVLYKLGSVLITKVLLPAAEAHINFVNVASSNMEKNSKVLDSLNVKLDTVVKAVAK